MARPCFRAPLLSGWNLRKVRHSPLAAPIRGTVGPALVTAGASTTDGTVFTTGSQTPAGRVLHFLAVACSHATAAEVPNSVTGNGIAWTPVTGGSVAIGSGFRRVSWFYGWGDAPTAGAITIGFATSHSGCGWALVGCPRATLSPPVQATTAALTGTTITGTLAQMAYPGNVHLYALLRSTQEDSVLPAIGAWTELADHPATSWAVPVGGLQVAWAYGELAAAPTWASSAAAAICSLEVA